MDKYLLWHKSSDDAAVHTPWQIALILCSPQSRKSIDNLFWGCLLPSIFSIALPKVKIQDQVSMFPLYSYFLKYQGHDIHVPLQHQKFPMTFECVFCLSRLCPNTKNLQHMMLYALV